MLHRSTNAEADANLTTSSSGQDISAASLGSCALIASDIRSISVGVVPDVCGRVARELDRVVLGSTGKVSNVLKGSSSLAIANGGIEEVVRGR